MKAATTHRATDGRFVAAIRVPAILLGIWLADPSHSLFAAGGEAQRPDARRSSKPARPASNEVPPRAMRQAPQAEDLIRKPHRLENLSGRERPRTPVAVVQFAAWQPAGGARSPDSNQRVEDAATFRTERQVLQRLKTAEELLAERRFGEAVRYLGSILEADEDYFFQRDDSAVFTAA